MDEARVSVDSNEPVATLFTNVRRNSALPLPWVNLVPVHDKVAVLVGGGPSLVDRVNEIRWRQNRGQVVFAQNGAAGFLVSYGIIPDFQVIIDAREKTAALVCNTAHERLICSQAHPLTVDTAGVEGVTLFHPAIPDIERHIQNHDRQDISLIGGGLTVGLVNMALAYTLGYRVMHLYGYDSSMREAGNQHAYPQERTEKEADEFEVLCAGKLFMTTPALLAQAQAFQEFSVMLANLDCTIAVHGDGLLPTIARGMLGQGHAGGIVGNGAPLRLRYDLALSPPTWDFISWLFNATVYQKKYGYGSIEVQFIPGPCEGFRHEPSGLTTVQKQQMLDNVCRPALALIGAREITEGGESIDFPYVMKMTVDAVRNTGFELPVLRPTKEAFKWAEQYRGAHVITLREADYWPERNSNILGWCGFAEFLRREGRQVYFVRDTARVDKALQSFSLIPRAATSLDHRLALYCVSKMNYFVSNGPAVLAGYSVDIPYITFMKSAPGYPCNDDAWSRKFMGIGHGEQWPWANPDKQKLVWCDDTLENILAAAPFTAQQRKSA